tara:strand:+ start:355 stop:483 length:129 start_codon:yes stop_codon:yes gene_type:complete
MGLIDPKKKKKILEKRLIVETYPEHQKRPGIQKQAGVSLKFA